MVILTHFPTVATTTFANPRESLGTHIILLLLCRRNVYTFPQLYPLYHYYIQRILPFMKSPAIVILLAATAAASSSTHDRRLQTDLIAGYQPKTLVTDQVSERFPVVCGCIVVVVLCLAIILVASFSQPRFSLS